MLTAYANTSNIIPMGIRKILIERSKFPDNRTGNVQRVVGILRKNTNSWFREVGEAEPEEVTFELDHEGKIYSVRFDGGKAFQV